MKLDIYLTYEDTNYLSFLTPLLGHHSHNIYYTLPLTVTSAVNESCDAIILTNPSFIKMVTMKNKCAIDDYAGSLWIRKNLKGKDIPILCIPPLKQLITTKPGKFLTQRFLSKIFAPEKWKNIPTFSWELIDEPVAISAAFDYMSKCDCISVDIETSILEGIGETGKVPIIVCCSYSAIIFNGAFNDSADAYTIKTFVLPITSIKNVEWMRKFNSIQVPKIFQNGKYDNLYFLRYSAPCWGWYYDTMEAHHAFFSELPKNLGYIAAFYIREIAFWKDEGKTGDMYDLHQYNAKDSWATALVFLIWMQEATPWALQNYLIKFPLVFPCLASEVDGLKINEQTRLNQLAEQKAKQVPALESIRAKLGVPAFNPRSPKQVLSLLHILGNRKETSSDEKSLERAGDKHPLSRLLIDEIKVYRDASKLISTYLEAELFGGKLLYSLNPSGTDTGRLASRESALWCGTQLQNLPEYYKRCIEAEEGYFFGEGDFEQAETRCTAYLSGDENLIKTVEDKRDFHCVNAQAFFGIPYDKLWEEAQQAKLNQTEHTTKRYLVKRVGHGSNYNMGEAVLLDTMGVKLVLQTKILLNLPSSWNPRQVCAHLLLQYDKTYPRVKHEFYDHIKSCVRLTKLLVSELGWTRLCFGTPWSSKPNLNSYVAHVPSNLSVGIINEAFYEIFTKIHLKSGGAFRLKGQIHDSIIFSYKEGRVDLAHHVKQLMTRPKQIKDCSGKTRLMTIPVSMKGEGKTWTHLIKI